MKKNFITFIIDAQLSELCLLPKVILLYDILTTIQFFLQVTIPGSSQDLKHTISHVTVNT